LGRFDAGHAYGCFEPYVCNCPWHVATVRTLLQRLKSWARRDPKSAGMAALLLVAAVAWMVVWRSFAKPIGASCDHDMDCTTLNCLRSVAFGFADFGEGHCTRECRSDPDCDGYKCDLIEVVAVREHERVPPDARRKQLRACVRR
jgi:hypothetical protein